MRKRTALDDLCWEFFEHIGTAIQQAWEDSGRPQTGPIAALLHDYRNMCNVLGRNWPKDKP